MNETALLFEADTATRTFTVVPVPFAPGRLGPALDAARRGTKVHAGGQTRARYRYRWTLDHESGRAELAWLVHWYKRCGYSPAPGQ